MDQFSEDFFENNKIAVYRNTATLKDYTSDDSFILINEELRDGVISKFVAKYLNQITSILDEAKPIENDYVLFRGLGSFAPFKESDFYVDQGFSSKTTSIETAEQFATLGGHLLEIKYPRGTKQIYMGLVSGAEEEEEFLSYPGEKLKLEKKIVSRSHTKYVCSYVGSNFDYPVIDESLDRQIEEIIFPIIDIYFNNDVNKKIFFGSVDMSKVINRENIYIRLYLATSLKFAKTVEIMTKGKSYKFNLS